ncbi:hypothetical protein NliqN6_6010 [Naganishia liquefaciens]|uniref:C2H2-type domain-containing protein n=1 Tax=Naganishia liquefaciens TaxID=104408 RepID=A0A8H3TYX6_9TREE|nr:hypothetical protein NliqN6_6010 [Naganishia liquefaciens]
MPVSCLACSHPRFRALAALRSHYESDHTWCITCKTTFPTAQALVTHQQTHAHTCTACFRCFTTRTGLVDHLASAPIHVHGDPELVQQKRGWLGTSPFYGCGLCDAEFQVMHQLAHHRRVVHAGMVRQCGEALRGDDEGEEVIRVEETRAGTSGSVAIQPDNTPRPSKKRRKNKNRPAEVEPTQLPPNAALSPSAPPPIAPQPPPHATQLIATQPRTPKKQKKKRTEEEGMTGPDKVVENLAPTKGPSSANGQASSATPKDPPSSRKRKRRKDASGGGAAPTGSRNGIASPLTHDAARSREVPELASVQQANGVDPSPGKRKKHKNASTAASQVMAAIAPPLASPPTNPHPDTVHSRPIISTRDVADAGVFLVKVHTRLRNHPETLAQLMDLLNTPDRMRDVEGVYTQMKALLACAPDLLVELSRFVAGVMRPAASASSTFTRVVSVPATANEKPRHDCVVSRASQPALGSATAEQRKAPATMPGPSIAGGSLATASLMHSDVPSSTSPLQVAEDDSTPANARPPSMSAPKAKNVAHETPITRNGKNALRTGYAQSGSDAADGRVRKETPTKAMRTEGGPTSSNGSASSVTRRTAKASTSSFASTLAQTNFSSSDNVCSGTGNATRNPSPEKEKRREAKQATGLVPVQAPTTRKPQAPPFSVREPTIARVPHAGRAPRIIDSQQSASSEAHITAVIKRSPQSISRPSVGAPRISTDAIIAQAGPAPSSSISSVDVESAHPRRGPLSTSGNSGQFAPSSIIRQSSVAKTTALQLPAGPSTPNPRKRTMPITEIFAMISPQKKANIAQSPVRPMTPPQTSPAPPKRLTGPFFCSSCDSMLDTFGQLIQHLLHVCTYALGSQVIEAQGYACQNCDKRFSQPWAFETHLIQEQTHMRKPELEAASAAALPTEHQDTDVTAAADEVICLTSPPHTPNRPTRQQPLPITPMTPGAIPQSSPVSSSLTDLIGTEDCTIYCRQCDLDLPAVEQLVDHFSAEPHENDTIYCYSCDETFDKPHLLWPHIFTSLRHENAPPNTRAEFSGTQFRWDALMSGQRCSGESPIEITGPGKTRKRRLQFQVVKARPERAVKVEDWSMVD